MRRNQRLFYNQSDALMGVIDVAVWDLKGKFIEKSLGTIFGLCRAKLPRYSSVGSEAHTQRKFSRRPNG